MPKKSKEIFNKLPVQPSSNVIINIKQTKFNEEGILPGYTQDYSDTTDTTQCKLCWNCCHDFNTQNISIPLKYNNGIFYLYGYFCSYACSARYILDNYQDKSMWEIYSLLNLYMNMSHNTKNKINPAPNRTILKVFGGTMDIDEFRSLSNESLYNLNIEPILPIYPINHTHNKLQLTKNVENNKEKYKLYRKSPINKVHNIYDTMNLITEESTLDNA